LQKKSEKQFVIPRDWSNPGALPVVVMFGAREENDSKPVAYACLAE
jgi:hypothetical protein